MGIFATVRENFPELAVEQNFSFAAHTTIGCGGKAEAAVSLDTAEECAALLPFLRERGIPHCYLGAGANVLPCDGVYHGVVVRFSGMRALAREGTTVFAEAGVTGGELLRYAAGQHLGGFEHFTGIPMTVGGGVAMNAGVAAGHFSDLVEKVVAFDGRIIRTFSAEECEFREKQSVFLEGIAVLGVYLRAKESFPEQIAQSLCYYRNKRAHLPKGKSMGCTFVNPTGISAGELIESCGLKGKRIGNAFVSEEHANFIINCGSSAQDIAALVEEIKNTVYKKTGILLREEIRRIGYKVT